MKNAYYIFNIINVCSKKVILFWGHGCIEKKIFSWKPPCNLIYQGFRNVALCPWSNGIRNVLKCCGIMFDQSLRVEGYPRLILK